MEIAIHTIEINAEIQKIYEVCSNVSLWPERFPPCKSTKIIFEDDKFQKFEITAEGNGVDLTWQSERFLNADEYRIDFQQTKLNPLLKSMHGIWKMVEIENGVLLILEHIFEVKDEVKGLIDNVNTKDEAIKFMHKSIHDNSTRELKSIKEIVEKVNLAPWETEFEEDINISTTPEQVYDLLFDAKKWPELLPHCNEIKMHYEDGSNQEFEMVVIGANEKLESMRSIRKGITNKTVEYFQPEPPPALKRHIGKWIITPTNEGVNLRSWHNIILSEEGVKKVFGDVEMKNALEIVTNAIKKNSMTTMQTLKSYLE